jgi:hypothetical protein
MVQENLVGEFLECPEPFQDLLTAGMSREGMQRFNSGPDLPLLVHYADSLRPALQLSPQCPFRLEADQKNGTLRALQAFPDRR